MKKYSIKSYKKIGIIVASVVALAALGIFAMRHFSGGASLASAVSGISENAVSAADIRMAVLRMDAIQSQAKVLKSLHDQRTKYEDKLKKSLDKKQKSLESEKKEIEKSQDMLSQEALQKRVIEYQKKVAAFQREISEKAQAIDTSFQKALVAIQEKYLDGVVEAIISKKKLSMVLDGRFARLASNAAPALDITNDVVSALDKRVTNFTMEEPKGF